MYRLNLPESFSPGPGSNKKVITLHNDDGRYLIRTSVFRRMMEKGLDLLEARSWDLSFVFINAEAMARLHREFLDKPGPTDVITFEYEDPERPPESGRLEGDIVLCPRVAEEQARAYKTSWQAELARYGIHGILHLMGYDDKKPKPRRVMKAKENEIVQHLEKEFSLKQIGRLKTRR
jgi:probable rRNA maturation factor